jgi:hypothetical protein
MGSEILLFAGNHHALKPATGVEMLPLTIKAH